MWGNTSLTSVTVRCWRNDSISQLGPKVLAWEGRTAGGKSPCGSTFSDHPMDNLTSQPQKNEIRRISKRILRLADKIPYSMHHKRDFLLHADFLWLRKRHLKRCLFSSVPLVTPRPPGSSYGVESIMGHMGRPSAFYMCKWLPESPTAPYGYRDLTGSKTLKECSVRGHTVVFMRHGYRCG